MVARVLTAGRTQVEQFPQHLAHLSSSLHPPRQVTPSLDRWFAELMAHNPHVSVVPITGAGHFLQEDAGEELAANIMRWSRA